ncbi:siderophore synthetase component [Peteryoungia aggregata LMG 23059]|uniref:Siderophore synthetase component n=1 Tax=Peteryoungia aggregata LMG 23059 TaxID=1368425 RepID=A0ABU0GAW1_9HYPH|nr:IucA/IucC family protein [Peteryoungia aggregata]MDQ0422492.1 siderophore synthetase component [Peteryoungia aggregata LMG 23059]
MMARAQAHTPCDPHAIAAVATFQSFANCYIREIDAGCAACMALDGCERRCLDWYLSGPRLHLRAVLTSESQVGPKAFGALFSRHSGERGWREIDPLWAVQCLVQDLAEKTKHESRPGAGLELMLRTLQSCARIADLAAQSAAQPLDNRPQGFLESEQSLTFGHWMHPTPKSLTGMSDWQSAVYAPEGGGRFALTYFAAPRDRVRACSVAGDLNAIVGAMAGDLLHEGALGDDEMVLPMHPLQAEALMLQPRIQALIEAGLLRPLGSGGVPFTATSSVRTVASDDCDWMLKFSLPVKITNSLRLNRAHELEAGVVMARLVDLLDIKTRLPKLGFLRDPAYLTLDLPGSSESGFEVILRENPYRGDRGEGVVSIAALTAPALPGRRQRLAALIERLAGEAGLARTEAAHQWFDRYLDCAVTALVRLYDETGIALEAHQQNMLVDVSQGWPSKVVYRDSQGFYLSERHRPTLTKALPELAEVADLFYPDAEIRRRFGYYLVVNQVFAVIHRMAAEGLADEACLLTRLRGHLAALSRTLRGSGLDFVRHLLDERTITTKANLGVRIAGIDELEGGAGASLYREMPNPLHPANLKTARLTDALAS